LRVAAEADEPRLKDAAIEAILAQATGAVAVRKAPAAPTPKKFEAPTFKDAPRYRLLEKAAFTNIKVKQGDEFIPLQDVVLDPEEQPMLQQLSGPFGGKGTPKRMPIEIQYDGIPDDHMEPLNESAEWMLDHVDELKAHFAAVRTGRRRRRADPVEALSIVGHGAEVVDRAA
jgi:hypothetical protein